jgi:hypothetical protein
MNRSILLITTIAIITAGCGQIKHVTKGSYVFRYTDNQGQRLNDPSAEDKFDIFEIPDKFKSKIDDKTDYLVIKTDSIIKASKPIESIPVSSPNLAKIPLNGLIYSSESDNNIPEKYKTSFRYNDFKFALQTLTIPLKFRNALDDGTKFPDQVETGINIGFAPVIKYNFNVFNPSKKIMGKSLNTYSINTGAILNLGATDLKASSNAPGIKSDRKAGMFTYGVFLMFGVNNINFGYAIGADSIIGEGSEYWVYQNKVWHGLIIALDIIKP